MNSRVTCIPGIAAVFLAAWSAASGARERSGAVENAASEARHAVGGDSQPATMDETALPAIFRGDVRLEAKVTVAQKNRPLGDVLNEMGRQIGVHLVASTETADDKATLFLDGRPAAEVLALIARHFGFQWRRSRNGYELTQELAARAREAALWESGRASQIAAIEARMGRVAQMASTPREQRVARWSEIERQLSDPNLGAAEKAPLLEEQAAMQDAQRPGGAAASAIFRSLSPPQLTLLRAGGEIRLSSTDGSLAPSLAQAVRQAGAEQLQRNAERMAERMAGNAGGSPPASTPPVASPASGEADISIRFSTSGFRKGPPRPGGPPVQLRFTLTTEQESGDRRRMLPVTWWPLLQDPAARMAGAVGPDLAGKSAVPSGDAAPAEPEVPTLRREVNLTFPGLKLPAAGTADPSSGGGKGGFGPGKPPAEFFWPSSMTTLGDLCEAVHRAAGLEMIADSFIRARLDAAKITGRRPLAQILDTTAGGLAYDWKKEGNLLRFRSRLYYQDRFAEVPERILRPWTRRVGHAGAPTLDDLAELAAALNDDQCSGMQEFWGWYLENSDFPLPPGPADFADNRQHLRFWAALGAAQKRAALSGIVLPVARMNGLQQRTFQAALIAPEEGPRGQAELHHMPTAAEIAAGGFSLQSRQLRQQLSTGTWPDGGSFMDVTRRLVSDPPDPSAQTGPNGIPLQPVGPPSFLDSYDFTYHLGGEPMPTRTASIDVPRPPRQRSSAAPSNTDSGQTR